MVNDSLSYLYMYDKEKRADTFILEIKWNNELLIKEWEEMNELAHPN